VTSVIFNSLGNFYNRKSHYLIFNQKSLLKLSSHEKYVVSTVYMYIEKAAEMTFVQFFLHKMLMKLTAGVNFINVLSTYSFNTRGAQKRKRDSEVVNLFMLLGTKRVKAVRRTLMKLSPGDALLLTLGKILTIECKFDSGKCPLLGSWRLFLLNWIIQDKEFTF